MNAIKINRHDSKVLKWLQSAASKDQAREVLNGINVNGNYTAADGFRLHVVDPSGLVELPEGTRDYGKIPASGLVEEPEAMPYSFPEYQQIIPRSDPVFEISVNPKLLLEALKGFVYDDQPVLLRFHSATAPMEVLGKIETKDGETSAYAIIMPMHLDDAPSQWKP